MQQLASKEDKDRENKEILEVYKQQIEAELKSICTCSLAWVVCVIELWKHFLSPSLHLSSVLTVTFLISVFVFRLSPASSDS